MTDEQHTAAQKAQELHESAIQEHVDAMTKLVKQLLIGDDVDKDEAKTVSLLEDCVARSDADAMVMLAKCCALAHGMKHNAKRAEALVSDAAGKGNDEACLLMQLINDWKGKQRIELRSLRNFLLKR